jgi:hypothetical protein
MKRDEASDPFQGRSVRCCAMAMPVFCCAKDGPRVLDRARSVLILGSLPLLSSSSSSSTSAGSGSRQRPLTHTNMSQHITLQDLYPSALIWI